MLSTPMLALIRSKRVRLVAHKLAINSLGYVIPPMVLYKAIRTHLCPGKLLPPGSVFKLAIALWALLQAYTTLVINFQLHGFRLKMH
jgi:hypothetical protein